MFKSCYPIAAAVAITIAITLGASTPVAAESLWNQTKARSHQLWESSKQKSQAIWKEAHSGTQEAWAAAHEQVRSFTGAPDDLMLFCGVAIGKANPDHPINSLISERAPLDEFATFL